jgi:phosphotransferase system enzyme I (PtsP)
MSPKVHVRGNKRLDGVLDFVAFAAKPMPLATWLDEAPRRIASIFNADICSLYLVEGDGNELVMRGNVGFSSAAIGEVRMHVGEGMTGEAVEYLRPVSSVHAPADAAYKPFDVLAEDRFPIFLAVPVRNKAKPAGALVIQRASVPFEDRDVELLTTLGAIVAAGIRHAELIDAGRERSVPRRVGGGTRKVTLTGRPFVAGRAIGAIAALRRPAARPQLSNAHDVNAIDDDRRQLRSAFEVAHKAIQNLVQRARTMHIGTEASFFATYMEILDDMRFRERSNEWLGEGVGIPSALSRVAREVTRSAASAGADEFLSERARDIEDLCDALVMLAAGDKRAALPSKALLVGDALTVFDLLISLRAHPVGIALTSRANGPRTRTILRLFGIPAIVSVEGLFRWASDGDVALVDADHGLLIINPSKGEISALREYKRMHEINI